MCCLFKEPSGHEASDEDDRETQPETWLLQNLTLHVVVDAVSLV